MVRPKSKFKVGDKVFVKYDQYGQKVNKVGVVSVKDWSIGTRGWEYWVDFKPKNAKSIFDYGVHHVSEESLVKR
jgi:hypothetical protein